MSVSTYFPKAVLIIVTFAGEHHFRPILCNRRLERLPNSFDKFFVAGFKHLLHLVFGKTAAVSLDFQHSQKIHFITGGITQEAV
jgi:hypothetical protein